ncbi:Mu transposase C-terminal domain-containing protein [Desulfuromonas acetoxidans]|uniref:Bacteriophage Mu transposase n=1 Tax=Desulfuromonas acetoxidans (strain DSM 684 / 11070) TaxID=281689 RepID=Q1JYS1_DESA6|nr:transposase domain-containing protein [Desulfuromonas acetoxidans]EAT15344.1 bacteriophage Mu transposase [Desulfuromonas acetoxidans DSM 684]MBF0646412.1 Mu transposase C-terminal domain-containing protein [Desulfuromonas acetoxidans]NVD24373.1 Mu transposase C-terminal domain-containing protein [Desulfuromonas acetoxidans]NVE16679.1 Mu transposase C-terminal domain-containing protein [Desulfuromonas acetoxidans]
MGNTLANSGWGTAKEYCEEGLPGLPTTERRCLDRLGKFAESFANKSRQRNGSKATEFHYSILPPKSQAPLAQRYPELFVSRQFQPNQNNSEHESRDILWDYYSRKTDKAKAAAQVRLEAVQMCTTLLSNGWKKTEAKEQVVEVFKGRTKVSFHTLGNWLKKINGVDQADWLPALVDGYTGRQTDSKVSPEAWDYIKADYLRRERPTWSSCYERLERAGAKPGWVIPSSKTLQRKLNKEIHPDLITLLRDGEDAYKKTLPAQERDRSVFHALEAVNGDGYTFFKYVRFESGEVCRPVCWFWQDIYSGKLLAWRVDVSENKDSIRLSIGDLVENYGIPKKFWLDNTRAAANKDVTGGVKNRYRFKVSEDEPLGLIPQLGAEVHWATPAHGQAKPVERAFGIGGIGEYTDKHPSFSGRGTKGTPIPIAEFEEILTAEVAAFNARLGRRTKICNGRSCDQVFNESYEVSRIKKATKEQRSLWLLSPEPVTANKNNGSIKIMDNRYWCEELSHYKGQKLVARFDPANMHGEVLVYTLDGRRVAEAECVLAAGFNDREAAREVAKQKRRRKKALREAEKAELRISAREASKSLPQVESPKPLEAKIVEAVFEKKKFEQGLSDSGDRFDRAVAMMKPAKKSLL